MTAERPAKPRRVIHAAVNTRAGIALLRDLDSGDIGAIVQFWYESGDEFLKLLGVDRSRLGTPQNTEKRFLAAIPTGDPEQQSFAFAITVNDRFCGYTLLNRYAPHINYSHWHITDPSLRQSGLSTAIYPHRIKTYFDLVPMDRLIHQTRTSNIGVNRMLDRYVPIAETRYIEHPDGVALPGEFHLRYVFRKDIPRFFEEAEVEQ
jgi:hypothetical protein